MPGLRHGQGPRPTREFRPRSRTPEIMLTTPRPPNPEPPNPEPPNPEPPNPEPPNREPPNREPPNREPPNREPPPTPVRRLSPDLSIQRPQLHRFADVIGGDTVGAGQVGNRPRDFEDPVVGAGAQAVIGHRHAQQLKD